MATSEICSDFFFQRMKNCIQLKTWKLPKRSPLFTGCRELVTPKLVEFCGRCISHFVMQFLLIRNFWAHLDNKRCDSNMDCLLCSSEFLSLSSDETASAIRVEDTNNTPTRCTKTREIRRNQNENRRHSVFLSLYRWNLC